MSSASNIQLLTVACMMGLVLLSFGVDGAPSKLLPKKGNHKAEESDPSSFRLILGSEFKTSVSPIQPINNDSISPWTYTFTHDDSLFPSITAEAKCLLTGCLIEGVEVQDYQSKPIYTQIMVLRKVRAEKPHYSFRLEHKTIAVGCTCVRPYVEHV